MQIFRMSIVIFGLRGFGAGLLLLTYSFVSQHGGASRVAELALALSVLTISGTISRAGLDQLVLREIQKLDSSQQTTLAWSGVITSGSIGFVCSVIAGAIWRDWLLAIGVCFFALYSIVPEVYRACGSAFWYAVLRNVVFNLFLAISVGALYFFGPELSYQTAAVFAAFFALIMSLPFYFGRFGYEGFFRVNFSGCFALMRAGIPIAAFQILAVVHSYGYNLVLNWIGSQEELAKFAVFLQVILIFGMFATSVGMHVGRELSVAVASRNFGELRRIYLESCFVSCFVLTPVFVLIVFFAESIFGELFGFRPEAELFSFYLMASGAFVNAITGPKITLLTMLGRERVIICVAVVLTVCISVVLTVHSFIPNKLLMVASFYSVFSGGMAIVMAYYALRVSRELSRDWVSK